MTNILITEDTSFGHLMEEVNAEIQSAEDYILPDDMVGRALERACGFFRLPEVPVVDSEGTCVWPNDPGTPCDDVIGFSRSELMGLGIRGEDSLTLVFSHECAHRALQSFPDLDPWEHELACDLFSGVMAGMDGIDTSNLEEALGSTQGSADHPAGALRAEFIEHGKAIAEEMQARHVPVTFEGCLERFNAHLAKEGDAIAQCRQEADVPVSPQGGEGHPLGFVNEKEWHRKQAREAFEKANSCRKEAEKAFERGDQQAGKDYLTRAASYDAKGKDHLKSVDMCTE